MKPEPGRRFYPIERCSQSEVLANGRIKCRNCRRRSARRPWSTDSRGEIHTQPVEHDVIGLAAALALDELDQILLAGLAEHEAVRRQ